MSKHNYHIEGRRWFQKTYGNTYHSVRIFKDGQELACLPMQYGYDNQYLETAEAWLADHAFPSLKKKSEYGSRINGGWQFYKKHGISHSVIDVTRQRDL